MLICWETAKIILFFPTSENGSAHMKNCGPDYNVYLKNM